MLYSTPPGYTVRLYMYSCTAVGVSSEFMVVKKKIFLPKGFFIAIPFGVFFGGDAVLFFGANITSQGILEFSGLQTVISPVILLPQNVSVASGSAVLSGRFTPTCGAGRVRRVTYLILERRVSESDSSKPSVPELSMSLLD